MAPRLEAEFGGGPSALRAWMSPSCLWETRPRQRLSRPPAEPPTLTPRTLASDRRSPPHRGVLFLDELCEFSRQHLEALRQPLEERTVTVARARAAVTYPADFTLIGAANPCPCGHLGDVRGCSCEPRQLNAYQGRLSGPIKDRIDLVVAVPRQEYRDIFEGADEEPSAVVRARVEGARSRQTGRPDPSNGALTGREILAASRSTAAARRLLALSGERLHLSARAFFRVLRVARTIADLAGEDRVGEDALAEALHYRIETAG
jgi:magnesium chelatase family protein